MKVKLLQDHTHAGTPHQAGAVIEVEDHRVEWLKENKIAEPAGETAKGRATKPNPGQEE